MYYVFFEVGKNGQRFYEPPINCVLDFQPNMHGDFYALNLQRKYLCWLVQSYPENLYTHTFYNR